MSHKITIAAFHQRWRNDWSLHFGGDGGRHPDSAKCGDPDSNPGSLFWLKPSHLLMSFLLNVTSASMETERGPIA